MNFLSVQKISKSFGEIQIIAEATFGLDQGDKIAIVGVNGGGKTTLLRIIAGVESPDSGNVELNSNITVSYLDQNPEFSIDISVLDAVLQGNSPALEVVKRYHRSLDSGEKSLDDLIHQMDALNAWDIESTINQTLGKLGINDPSQSVLKLSGGMKKRVALAKCLIEDPDFLILDEPTNHLDLDAIEWLENYLSNNKTTLLLVSHDRYFLEKVCNSIIEIDGGYLYRHKGSYASYLENKEERYQQQKREADKARNLLRKELVWLRRTPQARGSKAKYRIDKIGDLKKQAEKVPVSNDLDVNLNARKQGKKILELKSISKRFPGKQIVEKFSYTFKKGEKVGIIGKNGSGKSTFLDLITQTIPPDSGQIECGLNTIFGYYKQEKLPFRDDIKVIDAVSEIAEIIKLPEGSVTASQLLNRFMFPPKKQQEYISKLSGGEKKRLQLLRVLIKNPNFLILDEPTNDLDLITLNILEEYLELFSGCLIIVSHDRYFMDKLVDHLFIFKGNGEIVDFTGNYTDLRQSATLSKDKNDDKPGDQRVEKPRHNEVRKLTYKEKKEYEALENQLKDLERRKKEIANLLSSGETDHEKLMDWSFELEGINKKINTMENRWLELSEIME